MEPWSTQINHHLQVIFVFGFVCWDWCFFSPGDNEDNFCGLISNAPQGTSPGQQVEDYALADYNTISTGWYQCIPKCDGREFIWHEFYLIQKASVTHSFHTLVCRAPMPWKTGSHSPSTFLASKCWILGMGLLFHFPTCPTHWKITQATDSPHTMQVSSKILMWVLFHFSWILCDWVLTSCN